MPKELIQHRLEVLGNIDFDDIPSVYLDYLSDIIKNGQEAVIEALNNEVSKHNKSEIAACKEFIIKNFSPQKNNIVSRVELSSSDFNLNLIISEINQKKHGLLTEHAFSAFGSYRLHVYKTMLEKLHKEQEILKDFPVDNSTQIDGNSGLINQVKNSSLISPQKINHLLEIIYEYERQERLAIEKFLNALSITDPDGEILLRKKLNILDALLEKAQHTRTRFKDVRNTSDPYYTASTFFSLVSVGATLASFFPGTNLIAHPINVASDFLRSSTLNAAYLRDPAVPPHAKRVVQDNLTAAKHFNRSEIITSILGTGVLLGSLAVPILLPIGSTLIFLSNLSSVAAVSEELKAANKILQMEGFNKDIGFKLHVEALKQRLAGKKANALGSGLASIAAIATVLTIVFPPAGAVLLPLVGATLVTSALCALYEVKKGLNEQKLVKAAEYHTQSRSEDELFNGNGLKLLQQALLEKNQNSELCYRMATLKEENQSHLLTPITEGNSSNAPVTPTYKSTRNLPLNDKPHTIEDSTDKTSPDKQKPH